MDDTAFEKLVERSIAELPSGIRAELDNVGFVIEDRVRRRKKGEVGLAVGDELLGLYEGVPKDARGADYFGVLPDKITIFRQPIMEMAGGDPKELREIVRDTVWHEIGHHLGFDDDALHEIEDRRERRRAKRRPER